MPKNRDTPALFELVRSTGIKHPASASRENPLVPEKTSLIPQKQVKGGQAATNSPPPPSVSGEPVSLNRTVRLPLGYLFVASAATIVLLIIAYSVGYSRGINTSQSQRAGFLTTPDTIEGNEQGAANQADTNRLRDERPTKRGQSTPASTVKPTAKNNTTSGTRKVSRTRDTRRAGLNYIIVERFSVEEASRVADYLNRQGIDAMVLPSNNRHLRQVVVRQGFEGWSSNWDGLALLSRIKKMGRVWKSQDGGTKNFDQAYGNKYGG